jgi:hypothetical protein
MVAHGIVTSRSQARHLVKQKAVRCRHKYWPEFRADCDDLELPGKMLVTVGYKQFEIPVTPPEAADGCIHMELAEVQ